MPGCRKSSGVAINHSAASFSDVFFLFLFCFSKEEVVGAELSHWLKINYAKILPLTYTASIGRVKWPVTGRKEALCIHTGTNQKLKCPVSVKKHAACKMLWNNSFCLSLQHWDGSDTEKSVWKQVIAWQQQNNVHCLGAELWGWSAQMHRDSYSGEREREREPQVRREWRKKMKRVELMHISYILCDLYVPQRSLNNAGKKKAGVYLKD